MKLKKRLLLSAGGITAVGAVATLALGATFGLFSASVSSSGNTFTAGTVTMQSPMTSTCTVSDIKPLDSGTCTFTAAYGGADAANLGLDVLVAPGTEPGSVPECYGAAVVNAPATGLYDDSANGLQVSITDSNSTSYTGLSLGSASSHTNDLLVAKATTSTSSITFTLHWSMPDNGCVENNYQGENSSFTFTVHAVQSAHNASSGTLGAVDNSISWS